MKLLCFLFLLCFLQGSIAFQDCANIYIGLATAWGYERNAAGIFPNDDVQLSEDGKHFIPYNMFNHSSSDISSMIPRCPMFTCGRKTFPHGFYIFRNKPVMFCEVHRCINPENIKCRKTVEHGACGGKNEWVAGFVERKNATNEWLEVECCHSTIDDIQPAFVKNIAESGAYNHEVVVENGTIIAMDYVKDIKKIKDIYGQIVYSASIYRMKCSSFNTTNVPSIFDSAESFIDEDGTGKFEGIPKMCNKDSDFHVTRIHSWDGLPDDFKEHFQNNPTHDNFPPSRQCMPENCLKEVECKKNVKVEDCVEINQWVADFTKIENNETLLEVKCCQYSDEVNATFLRYDNFTNLNVSIYDVVNENQRAFEMSYINNITVGGSSENGTIYIASVYHFQCMTLEEKKAIKDAEEKSWTMGLASYFMDIAKRVQQSVAKTISIGEDGNITYSRDMFDRYKFMNVSSKTSEMPSESPSNDSLFNDTVSLLSL